MSKRKTSQKIKTYDGHPRFPVGALVNVLKPNLWFGYRGAVVAINEDFSHRVRLKGRQNEFEFHADIGGYELDYDL